MHGNRFVLSLMLTSLLYYILYIILSFLICVFHNLILDSFNFNAFPVQSCSISIVAYFRSNLCLVDHNWIVSLLNLSDL